MDLMRYLGDHLFPTCQKLLGIIKRCFVCSIIRKGDWSVAVVNGSSIDSITSKSCWIVFTYFTVIWSPNSSTGIVWFTAVWKKHAGRVSKQPSCVCIYSTSNLGYIDREQNVCSTVYVTTQATQHTSLELLHKQRYYYKTDTIMLLNNLYTNLYHSKVLL